MSADSLINITAGSRNELKMIERRLGELKSKAPAVLMRAVNDTARKVRKQIVKDAKGEYTLRDSAKLNATKAMGMKGARVTNPVATLLAEGPMLDLMDFLVSPQSISRGTDRPDAYSAQVKKDGGAKALSGNPKPFVTQFGSGHVAVAVRVPGRKMKSDPSRDFIKKLLSPSVPHLLNNEKVRDMAQELVRAELPAAIMKQINKVLEIGGG